MTIELMPTDSPQGFDIVAVGTSLGGVAALCRLLAPLPATFPVPIVVVQHLAPDFSSTLAEALAAVTALTVTQVTGIHTLAPATVYMAAPAHHLVVTSRQTVAASSAAIRNFSRPSVDVLFESAATIFGARAIGVILTGTLADGVMGIRAIKARGGYILVQAVQSAQATGMPQAAIDTGLVDLVLPLDALASALVCLVL